MKISNRRAGFLHRRSASITKRAKLFRRMRTIRTLRKGLSPFLTMQISAAKRLTTEVDPIWSCEKTACGYFYTPVRLARRLRHNEKLEEKSSCSTPGQEQNHSALCRARNNLRHIFRRTNFQATRRFSRRRVKTSNWNAEPEWRFSRRAKTAHAGARKTFVLKTYAYPFLPRIRTGFRISKAEQEFNGSAPALEAWHPGRGTGCLRNRENSARIRPHLFSHHRVR